MTTQTKAPAQPGWYWVKTDDWPEADWEAGEWDGRQWRVTSSDAPWAPELIEMVGPRIPTPDEPWQCVPSIPTDGMKQAGKTAIEDLQKLRGIDAYAHCDDAPAAYRYMLSAAPKP